MNSTSGMLNIGFCGWSAPQRAKENDGYHDKDNDSIATNGWGNKMNSTPHPLGHIFGRLYDKLVIMTKKRVHRVALQDDTPSLLAPTMTKHRSMASHFDIGKNWFHFDHSLRNVKKNLSTFSPTTRHSRSPPHGILALHCLSLITMLISSDQAFPTPSSRSFDSNLRALIEFYALAPLRRSHLSSGSQHLHEWVPTLHRFFHVGMNILGYSMECPHLFDASIPMYSTSSPTLWLLSWLYSIL